MARRLANATMPTRRMRLPLPAKRRLYGCTTGSEGCRAAGAARATPVRRASYAFAGLLPALLMPCSISLSPLWYRVGVSQRHPATSRRFAKRRQTNTSLTSTKRRWDRSTNALVRLRRSRNGLNTPVGERPYRAHPSSSIFEHNRPPYCDKKPPPPPIVICYFTICFRCFMGRLVPTLIYRWRA
ncbi:hypothetical protein LMG9964_06319 [Paraburkholderia phenoliruptrix]|uniref:Uncharacterized protein n=1 Tax=Paraburkholderia phenoliruptrix TaxID=252970 RepID=A0A6J5KEI4_9BURK|nr:hypothetical protein LMG9964_06319 [Paraburkholderia phenoliruptrix]